MSCPHEDLLALPCPQAWPFSLLLVTNLGEQARARGRGASRLVLPPAGLSPPSLRSAAASASGTRPLSTLGFWKHPLNPGSFPLGGVAVTDRTPPTEHRAPGACTSIQLQTGRPLSPRSKALGTQARGHHHHQPLPPHWVPSERPPCQDGCCPQGRGDARSGALHAGVGLMHPRAGPVPPARIYPLGTRVAELRRPCADAVVHLTAGSSAAGVTATSGARAPKLRAEPVHPSGATRPHRASLSEATLALAGTVLPGEVTPPPAHSSPRSQGTPHPRPQRPRPR